MLFSYFVIKLEMSNLVKFPNLSRKIVAVGRNYAEHAAELGNAVPSKPLLFMKVRQEKPLSKETNIWHDLIFFQPPSSYITAGEKIEIPLGCQELHHEIELGVVISKNCKRVSPDQAMDYVGGYCLALDMTARDFQVCLDCFKSLASCHQCAERGQV